MVPKRFREGAIVNGSSGADAIAPFSPGLARRFPFFAPLWTRPGVSFRFGTGKWGDCQMMIKATGRSALILAAGLFVCFAGSSQAAGTDDTTASPKSESTAPTAPVVLSKFTKHSAHHGKSYAQRKSSKVAEKPSDKKDAPADVAADGSDNSSAITPTVANANAQMAQMASTQMAATDVPGGNAKAMSARANEIRQAAPSNPADPQTNVDSQMVAADQLNDVDRALHESNPPALVMAKADTPDTSDAAPVMASTSSNEGSTWDQTSLIGKIFIGFGALLTMASAARMFMA
jgi:hypothetical protein